MKWRQSRKLDNRECRRKFDPARFFITVSPRGRIRVPTSTYVLLGLEYITWSFSFQEVVSYHRGFRFEKVVVAWWKNWIKSQTDTNWIWAWFKFFLFWPIKYSIWKLNGLDYKPLFMKEARAIKPDSRDRQKSSLQTEITAFFHTFLSSAP